MSLPPGAEIVVRTFGNKRGVIVAVARDGRYRVRVEGATMWCRDEELAPAEARKKKGAGTRSSREEPGPAAAADAARPGRIDLHGLTVADALSRVADEIDRALVRGADRVEVVHGKGSGRIRVAVHRQLAALPVVRAFRLDPRNPGVTWVHF